MSKAIILTRGQLISTLHSVSQGGVISEESLKELCRQAETELRRSVPRE